MQGAEAEIPISLLCARQWGVSPLKEEDTFRLADHFKKPKKTTVVIKILPSVSAHMWPARTGVKREIVAIGKREAWFIHTVIQGREPHTSFNQASLHLRSSPEDSSIWNNLFGHETEYINLWLNFRIHVTAQM